MEHWELIKTLGTKKMYWELSSIVSANKTFGSEFPNFLFNSAFVSGIDITAELRTIHFSFTVGHQFLSDLKTDYTFL